ncbi:MAG: resolvase, partial [Candidatus Nitrosotenuis sp.]
MGKPSKDNKKIARTRRQRGYHWEDTLVKRFNGLEDWKAFRLGSPSVALPDILAVSTSNST